MGKQYSSKYIPENFINYNRRILFIIVLGSSKYSTFNYRHIAHIKWNFFTSSNLKYIKPLIILKIYV